MAIAPASLLLWVQSFQKCAYVRGRVVFSLTLRKVRFLVLIWGPVFARHLSNHPTQLLSCRRLLAYP